MASNQRAQQASTIPLRARFTDIKVVGELPAKSSNTRPDHFVIVSVDDKEVVKSEARLRVPAPRWEWPEGHQFLIHPSSTIKIVIYRKGSTQLIKHLVGQYSGKVVELLENDDAINIKYNSGGELALKLQINLSLVSAPDDFKSIAETVDADVSHPAPAGIPALGKAFYLTKDITDIVADARPILKTSATVISVVYGAVRQADLDDTVRDLAQNLQEMLGVAKERSDLLLITGTTDDVEEIGRMSLKVASLIHEYALRPRSFIRRTLSSQSSDDRKSRIAMCQKCCNDLKETFDRRINMDTKYQEVRMESTIREISEDQLAKKIFKWLSAPDGSKNYNEARKKRQDGTCTWFLNGERFSEFQEKAGLLWIKGTGGCGKTVLISSIIEKINDELHEDASIAYFFFDGRDAQRDLQLHDKLIRSLILQLSLLRSGRDIPAALVELYGHGQQQPSTQSLQDTLQRIIEGLGSTYIIIDSLDECTERHKMLAWISDLSSRRIDNLHMVVASRPEPEISDILQPLDPRCVNLAEEGNLDVELYVEQQISLVERWDEETRKIVKSRLIGCAEGMFRWIALQIMELKKCSNRHSVIQQLDNSPKGLYETYDQILLRIDDQTDRMDTNTFLLWLCFSTRPLTLVELTETVVVDFAAEDGPRYTPSRRYWDEQDVLERCSGFITESEGKVKLAHFSVKEYLISENLRTKGLSTLSDFHLTEELSHSLISQTCLVCLLQLGAYDTLDEKVIGSFRLIRYAAEHWIFHAQSGDIDKSGPSLTLAQNLFQPAETAFINWVRIYDLDRRYHQLDLARRQTSIALPIYYAARAGLKGVSQYLLEKGTAVNAQGGFYGNALQAASNGGHEMIVKMLLDKGAKANAHSGYFDSALQAASYRGHDTIVMLLLEEGADVNAQDGKYGNALQAASLQGYETIVKLLLEKGANVNAQGGFYGNALQAASYAGHEVVVKLLLEKGANVNAQGGDYGNALQAASKEGEVTIVKLLLEKGVDVNMQGGPYGNALQAASKGGHDTIVKLLLDNGANVPALSSESIL